MEAEWPAGKGQKGEEEDRLAWLNRRRQIFGWTGPKPSRTKSCKNGAEVQLLDDTRFDTRPSGPLPPSPDETASLPAFNALPICRSYKMKFRTGGRSGRISEMHIRGVVEET